MKAKPINTGATIGIIAPGSSVEPICFKAGIQTLHDMGYKTKCPLDPTQFYGSARHGFASESARARSEALMQLVEDKEVSAIVAARGGYGTIEMLPLIDYERIREASKLIIGYSDVTVLLAAITGQTGLPTIHGPAVAVEFARCSKCKNSQESVDVLFSMMRDSSFRAQYQCKVLRDGVGEGIAIAGNLTMLLTLLSSPWDLDYEGAILVVEDINEAPYRIHRGLMQLKYAGKLDKLAGFVFGRFYGCKSDSGWTVEDVMKHSLDDVFEGTTFPVFSGLDFGHVGKNLPVPFGCKVRLQEGLMNLVEAPVS